MKRESKKIGHTRRRGHMDVLCAVLCWAFWAGCVSFIGVAAYLAATVEDAPCLGGETAHETAWHDGRGRGGW